MPDFTVIDGGGKRRGPSDFEADMARQQIDTLIVEILRAVARGDDHENRVGRTLIKLFKHLAAADVPVYDVTSGPIADAHKSISGDRDGYQMEIAEVVLASLRVAAESCATDGFAASRKSKAESRLDHSIKERILGSETRSRQNGWSYLARFLADNFPKTSQVIVKEVVRETPVVRQSPRPRRPEAFGQKELKEFRKAIKAKDSKKISELASKIGQPPSED
jgi:hypothetical protein